MNLVVIGAPSHKRDFALNATPIVLWAAPDDQTLITCRDVIAVGISLVAVCAALRLRSLLAGARVSASPPGGIPGTLEDLVLEAQPA